MIKIVDLRPRQQHLQLVVGIYIEDPLSTVIAHDVVAANHLVLQGDWRSQVSAAPSSSSPPRAGRLPSSTRTGITWAGYSRRWACYPMKICADVGAVRVRCDAGA